MVRRAVPPTRRFDTAQRLLCGLLGATGLLLCLHCAPKIEGPQVISVQDLIDGGKKNGLDLENPFDITPEMAAEVEKEVGVGGGTPTDRMRRLTRYLNDRGYINFQYEANKSLTAIQAWKTKRGDCMAYTNLYVGLARHLKIPVFFVHISETQNYYERDGLYFVSSHMAVGCLFQYYTVVVDFTEQKSEYSLALYDSTDDSTAVALFYNNVAVDYLMEGEVQRAEQLLRYLIAELPNLKEAQNNLGVVLMRQGRFAEALKVLQDAIALFPEYQPLYTNATQAAKGAGQPELAKSLEVQGKRFLEQDPFFIFNQGLARFQQKDYPGALALIKKALSRQPNSPMLCAWIAKIQLTAGDEESGKEAFARAQKLAPTLPMLKMLRGEFPALQTVPQPIDPGAARQGTTRVPLGGPTPPGHDPYIGNAPGR